MIPEDAVEAAARALYERDTVLIAFGGPTDLPGIRAYMDEARTVLEAAAPHLMAAAWDSALQDADDVGYLYEHQTAFIQARNPYRKLA